MDTPWIRHGYAMDTPEIPQSQRPKPPPAAGFPMAKTFNETVGMDVKEWSHSPKYDFCFAGGPQLSKAVERTKNL